MRTEQEMMDLILGVARADERIRAVSMEGSRADPNAPKDKYQDYDITYYVTEVNSFVKDRTWLSAFGTPLIVQEPDLVDNLTGWFSNEKHDFERSYGWLMLFDDGNRIDLGVYLKDEPSFFEKSGEPSVVLLDKDEIMPKYPAPSDAVFRVKKPNEDKYNACCNEFWWCLNNVAKGIARDELSYTMWMYNHIVRDMLNHMVEWHIGTLTDFSVTTGKCGKYFKRYLPTEIYAQYAATYSGSDYGDIWAAVLVMCDLFHTLALQVAGYLGFTYRQEEEDGMREYMRMVKNTPLF